MVEILIKFVHESEETAVRNGHSKHIFSGIRHEPHITETNDGDDAILRRKTGSRSFSGYLIGPVVAQPNSVKTEKRAAGTLRTIALSVIDRSLQADSWEFDQSSGPTANSGEVKSPPEKTPKRAAPFSGEPAAGAS